MSAEVDASVHSLSARDLPPPLVTIEDGDLLSHRPGLLVVKPLDSDIIYSERIGVVPSTLLPSTATGASIPVLELKAKWEIPPPPDCAPPPPPFTNSLSGPSSWDPPAGPHDPNQCYQDVFNTNCLPCSIPPPPLSTAPHQFQTDARNNDSSAEVDITAAPCQVTSACEPQSEDVTISLKMSPSSSQLLLGGDEGLGDDEALIDDYDDDDEDDDDGSFTVHFAHHGRKECDSAAGKVDLLAQISELQDAVSSMKCSLTEAVGRLGAVSEDPVADNEVASKMAAAHLHQKEKCDANTAEVLKLVLDLKGDVSTLKKDVSTITERQDGLQRALDSLLEDRRTDPLPRSRSSGAEGRSSGSHSTDSGVALLLERAHQAFHGDRSSASPAASTMHRTSDQDSLPEQPSLLVPPLVYDYVAGLRHQPQNIGTMEHDDMAYDSDSSLTAAANKSISLSATISKDMRAGMASADGEDSRAHKASTTNASGHGTTSACNTSNNSSTDSRGGPDMSRTDSDGSDQSRDVTQHTRRRRYEKGSSSSTSKLYGPLRPLSQDIATYQALSAFGPATSHSLSHGLYSHTSHSHYQHRSSKDSHRCRVARELLETEKKYCRTLWIIQDTFAEPLKKCGILSQKDINTLFPPEVYQLYDKHCHLQHQLRERLASWQWQPLVGDILAKFTDEHHSDVLRLYTSYVNDFPDVLKTFHKLCRSSPSFTKFIKCCLDHPSCGGLDLGAFLLTPVQRIPRYILLLKQLLKYTDESHPDFHHVNVCLDRLKDFLERLNASIEHSFQLVHATFSAGSLTDPAIALTVRHGRVSRSPRRTRSTVESPTYSPERPPSSAETQSSRLSPKRSISIAGGAAKTLTVNKRRPQSSDAGRSRSLPRAAPLSPNHETSTSRSNLASAKSVADVTQGDQDDEDLEDQEQVWDDLGAGEPSLLEVPTKIRSKAGTLQHNLSEGQEVQTNNSNMSSAHSTSNLVQDAQRLQPRTDSHDILQDDGTAKKKSIKSSLKNMFTFKKRSAASPTGPRPSQHHHHFHHPHDHHHHHHHTAHHHPPRPATSRGMREESDYWDPQTHRQGIDQTAGAVTSSTSTQHLHRTVAQIQPGIQVQPQVLNQQQQQQQQQSAQLQQTQTAITLLQQNQPTAHLQQSPSSNQMQQLVQQQQQNKVSPSSQSSHLQQVVQSSCPHQSGGNNSIYQSLSSMTPHCQTPVHMSHPPPPSTPVPGQIQPSMSIVGDFVDEDGNPCSNV